mmetsp:Transcript_22327/g.69935  ORF Transcript_22327/g.69935 Transcript_22327/m.69935 type:complete len:557 (-) Transcript_22327:1707-3377(-)
MESLVANVRDHPETRRDREAPTQRAVVLLAVVVLDENAPPPVDLASPQRGDAGTVHVRAPGCNGHRLALDASQRLTRSLAPPEVARRPPRPHDHLAAALRHALVFGVRHEALDDDAELELDREQEEVAPQAQNVEAHFDPVLGALEEEHAISAALAAVGVEDEDAFGRGLLASDREDRLVRDEAISAVIFFLAENFDAGADRVLEGALRGRVETGRDAERPLNSVRELHSSLAMLVVDEGRDVRHEQDHQDVDVGVRVVARPPIRRQSQVGLAARRRRGGRDANEKVLWTADPVAGSTLVMNDGIGGVARAQLAAASKHRNQDLLGEEPIQRGVDLAALALMLGELVRAGLLVHHVESMEALAVDRQREPRLAVGLERDSLCVNVSPRRGRLLVMIVDGRRAVRLVVIVREEPRVVGDRGRRRRDDGLGRLVGGLGRRVDGLGRGDDGLGRRDGDRGRRRHVGGLGRLVDGLGRRVDGLGRHVDGLGRLVNGLGHNVAARLLREEARDAQLLIDAMLASLRPTTSRRRRCLVVLLVVLLLGTGVASSEDGEEAKPS